MRPKIVTEIETIIWEEIFALAKGSKTVQDAAYDIVERIPEIYDHFHVDERGWFKLGML